MEGIADEMRRCMMPFSYSITLLNTRVLRILVVSDFSAVFLEYS